MEIPLQQINIQQDEQCQKKQGGYDEPNSQGQEYRKQGGYYSPQCTLESIFDSTCEIAECWAVNSSRVQFLGRIAWQGMIWAGVKLEAGYV